MLLTLFYMISTWVQAWRLSSLKARLAAALNLGLDSRPSIMFYTKQNYIKDDLTRTNSSNEEARDFFSSELCRNKNIAKLGDLLWCQGDKRLCTIYPQQIIDVNDWLVYPLGHTVFPLHMNNHYQSRISEDTKMHVLIETEINQFNPNAFTKIVKLEDYGLVVAWTVDKTFSLIIETDLDHLTNLSIALMQSPCFINNGFLLGRVESVEVSGKPCTYNIANGTLLQDKRLVGKAQWEAHIERLKHFSSTSRHVAQQEKPFEIESIPGVVISPGNNALNLHIPTILEMNPVGSESTDRITPTTPPPTPASLTAFNQTINPLEEQLALSNRLPSTSEQVHNSTEMNSSEVTSLSASVSSLAKTKTNSRLNSAGNVAKYSPKKKDPENDSFDVSMKPPNVLIYSDSQVARDNIKSLLKMSLQHEKYIIYNLADEEAKTDCWIDQAALVVVCGNVDSEISTQLLEYLVKGGKLLTLCSDALHSLLPSFKTAEVREHELVRFSYGRWKNVRMMHHIFCYQASPIKSKFSQDHEDSKATSRQPPVTANIRDKTGKSHTFHVRVLGTEETWQTPSIVLADLSSTGGKAVFSQIHLEADPSQYEFEEIKYKALKESNQARLEIIRDVLGTHLSMDTAVDYHKEPTFVPAYFLGTHELKLLVLENLKSKIAENDVLTTSMMKLQFCGANTKVIPASSSILPIMVHQCPDNFSTVDYFENLSSKDLGRIVIYSDIMTSSMNVVAGCRLHHGLVVIPRQQTHGRGRNKNIWLSPIGCAMFTMQMHIPLNSYIGRHLPILQHIVPVALVSAVKSIPGYENIDLRLKWPNDIYAGSSSKLGGLIVTTTNDSSTAICDIGLGINLSNEKPTCSVNDVISRYNEKHKSKLPLLTFERFLALVFSELENLYNVIQEGNIEYFYDRYYEYWLHTNAEVSVVSADGMKQDVKIIGIDEFGFLEVETKKGQIFTVQPDGNSYDMLKGLISPSSKR